MRSGLKDTPQRNKSLSGFVKCASRAKYACGVWNACGRGWIYFISHCKAIFHNRYAIISHLPKANISLIIPTEKKNRLILIVSLFLFICVGFVTKYKNSCRSVNCGGCFIFAHLDYSFCPTDNQYLHYNSLPILLKPLQLMILRRFHIANRCFEIHSKILQYLSV